MNIPYINKYVCSICNKYVPTLFGEGIEPTTIGTKVKSILDLFCWYVKAMQIQKL